MPDPVTPVTPWACSLAALSWNLQNIGINISQDQIMIRFFDHYPVWSTYKGFLGRWDIINLVERMGISVAHMIYSGNKDELLTSFNSHNANFLMGFVFTFKPTNHTMAMTGISADHLAISDGALPQSNFGQISWDNLKNTHEGKVMLIYR